jgi:hypothetical protein
MAARDPARPGPARADWGAWGEAATACTDVPGRALALPDRDSSATRQRRAGFGEAPPGEPTQRYHPHQPAGA